MPKFTNVVDFVGKHHDYVAARNNTWRGSVAKIQNTDVKKRFSQSIKNNIIHCNDNFPQIDKNEKINLTKQKIILTLTKINAFLVTNLPPTNQTNFLKKWKEMK